MRQCLVELGLCFDVFPLFAMHFNLRNYMSRYLGNKELCTCSEDIIISNKLVWVEKRVSCPIGLLKNILSQGEHS